MSRWIRQSLGVLFVFLSLVTFGQTNLIPENFSNFQTQFDSWPWPNNNVLTTDYTYVSGYGALNGEGGAGKMTITAQAHNANTNFFYCAGHPSNHSTERFLVINGFGGTRAYTDLSSGTPSNKKVLRYTLNNLLPNVFYDFSFWATNLSNGTHTMAPQVEARVIFKVVCNGTTETQRFQPTYTENTPVWTKSPVYRFLANSNGQLTITLYDDCEWLAGYGDDFGIDDVTLVKAPEYSVQASPFIAYGCNGSFDPVNVLSHVTINQPSGQPSLPTVVTIRKTQNDSWGNAVATEHGSAVVGADNKVYYTPNEGYFGSDQLQYKVEKYGESSSATLNIQVLGAPSNFTVYNFPEDHYWCKGEPFNFSASCTDNGAPLSDSLWQWTESLTNPSWHTLNFSNFPNSSSCVDYYVRYRAQNACGVGCSDTLLLHICDQPVLNTMTISTPNTICQGGSLPTSYLSQVQVNNWNNDTGTAGWLVKPVGGSWVPLADYDAGLFQGDQIKYHAENCCGEVETNAVTVNATDGPEFIQPLPGFNNYYCVGEALTLPSVPASSYTDHGIQITDQYWARSTDGETYTKITGTPTLDLSWDGNYLCYRLECSCGTVDSPNPFQLHVYDAPVFTTELDTLDRAYCAGETLAAPAEPEFYSYPGTDHGWAISQGQDSTGSYSPVSMPMTLSFDDNGKWLKHWAQGCSVSFSNAVQIQVNDRPTLASTTLGNPDDICAGGALDLPTVSVLNYNGDQVGEGYEIFHNGSWEPYDPGTPLGMDYNGASLRYWAESSCGRTYAEGAVITVIQGPEFINPQPLSFEPFYCAVDVSPLVYPTNPAYQSNGSNPTPYWAWSEDGVDYEPINGTIILTEEWNGRYINFMLDSDCGAIRYPIPFQLTVYGAPEVDEIDPLDDPYCPGESLAGLGVPAVNAIIPGADQGWQLSLVTAPSDDLDQWENIQLPYVLDRDDNGKWLRYYASGCEIASSNWVQIKVGDRPTLNVTSLNDPDPICAGSPLDPSYLGAVEVQDWNYSYVDGSSYERWEIFYQGQWHELPNTFPMAFDGCPLRYHAVNNCGETELTGATLHVMEQPSYTYAINPTLCAGQPLYFDFVSGNDAPVDGWLWRLTDENGNETLFDPDSYLFETPGTYQVSYAVYNQCNVDDPTFSSPMTVFVTAGPQFSNDNGWPGALPVCDGSTLAEALANSGLNEPALVDPNVAHTPLGWFVKYKDEDNNTQYALWQPTQVITEEYHGAELCFGMNSDCSSIPIYSTGLPIHVYGQPEILSLSLTQNLCSGETFPPADFAVDIDPHNNIVTDLWQCYSDGQWVDMPATFNIQNQYDGMQFRYVIRGQYCDYQVESNPVMIYVAGVPEIVSDISDQVAVCDNGALSVTPPQVLWHNTLPETGEWQVSPSPNGPFGLGPFNNGALVLDLEHVSSDFDGWYLRYHVEGCNQENNSNVAQITVLASSEVHIAGESHVLLANSFWPGVYYYYTEVVGGLTWTLDPPIWTMTDTVINGKSCCVLVVDATGQATLTAQVGDGSCGFDEILISAKPFSVDEAEMVPVKVYPNPAQHIMNVVSENIEEVTVYDLLGQQLIRVSGSGQDQVNLAVGSLSEGLYIVEVITGNGIARKTVVVGR